MAVRKNFILVILTTLLSACGSLATITPQQSAESVDFSAAHVTTNAEWQPLEQEIESTVMVLVPAGCFMIGRDTGPADEKPSNEICFESPFWIDKTEVTQAQFAANHGQKATPDSFAGDNHPVEHITWFEAQAYCVARGGRLPTEAEWEYAARGPDNLGYPWGDTFVSENTVINRSGTQGTVDVGSLPKGQSWVGALDMSGNVWEWTLSLYLRYPYSATDGREDITTTGKRVIRGGAWLDHHPHTRGSIRSSLMPDRHESFLGFRCAASEG